MTGIEIKKVGMLGVGSMGAMMTLLMAERGYEVFFYDPSDENMDTLEKQVKDIHLEASVHRTGSYEEVCRQLGSPKVFMFSTPHGSAADKCIEGLKPHLSKGDLIIDCGNEHWESTERRQADLERRGVYYVGCGVSGGYQSARAGPSMAPGGSPEALELAMPFLRSLAARDVDGRPCTAPVGPRGSGHYVKMVHNGIEHGMQSVLAEVWMLMTQGLGLSHDEVGDVLDAWNRDPAGPLRDCFLIAIGADIQRARTDGGEHVVAQVRDKVVQDVDEEEGTGTWTCAEAIARHVPAASILSAHAFRVASADEARRRRNRETAQGSKAGGGGGGGVVSPSRIHFDGRDNVGRLPFVETLKHAVYFCFLACFAQGMDLIRAKDVEQGWGLDYANIMQLWRGGCIIKAEHIVADLLQHGVYARADRDPDALLGNPEVAGEMAANYAAARETVLKAVQADLFVPAVSQSLEYYKYETSTSLPTQFMEAQMDYFGQHMFDRKDEPESGPVKGRHHFEWKPAKGSSDQ
ncbi:6-phosphogluconate dehydrogenase [Xylariaceae sp. FL0804]|nr:6-phosphogluconate dehydrogenase [Xylariaceae sp. FL0804]